MRTTRQILVLATALLLAMATVQGAQRWCEWAPTNHGALAAAFVPWADSRQQDFDRLLCGYASLYDPFSPFVGEIVLSPGPETDGNDTALQDAVTLVVETAVLPPRKAGAPSVANDAHYASNPFFPFGVPTGTADEASFTFSSFFPTGSPFPLRAPVFAASVPRSAERRAHDSYGNLLLRVRWKVLDRDGATVASGILPDAFSTKVCYSSGKAAELHAWRKNDPSGGKLFAWATDATFRAWPMLACDVESLSLDADVIDRVFGGDPKAFDDFLRRARLVGLKVHFDKSANQSPVFKSATAAGIFSKPAVIELNDMPRYMSLGEEAPCLNCKPQLHEHFLIAEQCRLDEKMIAPARMPGDTLGRNTTTYKAATSLFMLFFAVGTAALLIRFFAKRRGEARLTVWTALPAWCLVASAMVFLAIRPLLDRAPRADVTEWRYAIAGEPEELRVECGRAHSFSRRPSAWTMPEDGWFTEQEICEGASLIHGRPAGKMTFSGKPLVRGEREEVMAMRFAPHSEEPVAISADPDADPATPEEFTALLKGWVAPDAADAKPPVREVTANADFAGVWVFTRGLWYGLGPMKRGETQRLDASMRIWHCPDLSEKTYTTLFMKSPFSVRVGRADITKKAEAWLAAKDSGEPPPIDGDLARAICSAAVFALRGNGGAEPDLMPSFKGPLRPVITSRIVHVEVFP